MLRAAVFYGCLSFAGCFTAVKILRRKNGAEYLAHKLQPPYKPQNVRLEAGAARAARQELRRKRLRKRQDMRCV